MCECPAQLTDTGQSRLKHLLAKMIQLELDMVPIGSASASFKNFHDHGSCDHIPTGQILSIGRITLHETLAILIDQVSTLSAASLGDQRACAINPSRMELPHLHILRWNTCSEGHSHAIAGVDVGVGRRCINPARTTRSEYRGFGFHINSLARLDTNCDHANHCTILVLHKVYSEPLIEEHGFVLDVVLVERVQRRVPRTIGCGTGSRRLPALSEIF